MGSATEETLQFVKDVREMGENLDIEVNEKSLEKYADGVWTHPPIPLYVSTFDHEVALVALWKTLDAFISRQIEEIQKAQAKTADATIHVGADGHCEHHGEDTPYLKVLMGTLDDERHYEILCVRCIVDFLSHHTEECAAHIGPITFEGAEGPERSEGKLRPTN